MPGTKANTGAGPTSITLGAAVPSSCCQLARYASVAGMDAAWFGFAPAVGPASTSTSLQREPGTKIGGFRSVPSSVEKPVTFVGVHSDALFAAYTLARPERVSTHATAARPDSSHETSPLRAGNDKKSSSVGTFSAVTARAEAERTNSAPPQARKGQGSIARGGVSRPPAWRPRDF